MTTTIVYMPLEESQLYFNTGEGVSGIEVMVADPETDTALLPAIDKAAGPVDAALTWQDLNGTIISALAVESNTMFLILSLIILVAALNIVSGLIMLVKDKSADIAILRTMGATRGAMMRIFFIAGAASAWSAPCWASASACCSAPISRISARACRSLTGTKLFDPTVYFLSQMPAQMDPGQVASRGGDGAVPDLHRHALSGLAGGAARSGRGAAL